jgi:hypothetical protein
VNPNDPNMTPAGMPPMAPRKRHHYIRWTFAGFGALILLIVIIGVAAGSSKGKGTTAAPQQSTAAPATQAAVPAAATPTPTVNPVTEITFTVTGTGDPSITYGTDSDNRDGGGTLGQLGDGNATPWTRTLTFDGSALYYFMDAQLEGAGNISCKITATGPGDAPLTVATGHASGNYNICSVQAAPSDSTGTSWQTEG